MNRPSTDTIVQEIAISASADRVFDAFARAEERLKWWGRTDRFHTTRVESDLRVGGPWMMWFETPHGPATVGGEYQAIERPRLLVFTWRPSWYDGPDSLVRIDLEEANGLTHVRLTHSGLVADAERNNSGWPALLTALRAYLEGRSVQEDAEDRRVDTTRFSSGSSGR